MIIYIGFLLAHVRSRDGAQDQENAPMSPDPFPRERLGSGNETNEYIALVGIHMKQIVSSCFEFIVSNTVSMTSSVSHLLAICYPLNYIYK